MTEAEIRSAFVVFMGAVAGTLEGRGIPLPEFADEVRAVADRPGNDPRVTVLLRNFADGLVLAHPVTKN